jgi:hypothetical protein
MHGETESALVDADQQQVRKPPDADAIGQQVLTAHGEHSLREEAVGDDGTARTWADVQSQFEGYLMKQDAARETWESDKQISPTSHRFTPEYADRVYGEIHGGLRWLRDNTPADAAPLKTALLTLTGWPFDGDGEPAPPVEFLQELAAGRQRVLDGLRRRLDDRESVKTWGYCWLLEPHDQRGHGERRRGYPHCQVGVAAVGDLTRDDLADLVIPDGDEDRNSPYLRGNPFARARDHGEEAVTMREQGDDADGDAVMALAAELANGLLGYRFDLSTCHISYVPLPYRRLGSLLWATNTPSVGHGGHFPDWVERSQQEYEAEEQRPEPSVDASQFDDDAGPEWTTPDPVEVGYSFPEGFEQ